MAKMTIDVNQMVEMHVHTYLLTSILRTLNEISCKLQNPDHEIEDRIFDREKLDDAVDTIRTALQEHCETHVTVETLVPNS